jgi:DNA-binding MarR family transcriptional regulator
VINWAGEQQVLISVELLVADNKESVGAGQGTCFWSHTSWTEHRGATALPSGMPKVRPLNADEELFWRALMRLLITLPRQLDRDMIQAAGLTANEYTTIMNLSEAPNREMRMADLANASGLSASRMTRLVDDLVARGFIIKRTSSVDGRGNIAKLTPKGMAKLKSAWPAHLATVRERVFAQLDPAAVANAAAVLDVLATTIGVRNASPSEHP